MVTGRPRMIGSASSMLLPLLVLVLAFLLASVRSTSRIVSMSPARRARRILEEPQVGAVGIDRALGRRRRGLRVHGRFHRALDVVVAAALDRAAREKQDGENDDDSVHGDHRLLVTNWSISSVVEIAREAIS
jgi:hypothetical protein